MNPPSVASPPASPEVFSFEVPAGPTPIRAALALVRALPAGAAVTAAARTWLVGAEHERLARFLVDHARAEFLAGRMAAKAALAALDPAFTPATCEIVPGLWRQPTLRPDSRGRAVTLAHGGGLGLALAFDDRWLCGIDVELATRTGREIIMPLVTTCERDWADAAPDARASRLRWALLWTAREALGKMLRTGIARPGLLLPLADVDEGAAGWSARFAGADDVAVHATCAGDHVVSIAVPVTDGSADVVRQSLDWLRTRI